MCECQYPAENGYTCVDGDGTVRNSYCEEDEVCEPNDEWAE